jgi:NAD(P)-dependent dehydrogenase (short-subunit alcohol dehydrogenase family)
LPEKHPFQEASMDGYRKAMQANVDTAVAMTLAALEPLRQARGVILLTGSEAGINGKPNNVVYGAAKGWLHSFAKGLALEQAEAGVRVNCVCPGPVATGMLSDARQQQEAVERVPLGRLGRPEEVAGAMVYLASDEASFITGALLVIDGAENLARTGR